MNSEIWTIIAATGSYIPSNVVKNEDFLKNEFYDSNGKKIANNPDTINKFEEITGIKERRWADDNLVTSDIAFFAAEQAFNSSAIDKETIDYIIVAHNFGDVRFDNRRSDLVPSLAARVKARLGIKNPYTVAYDLPFGCPGWLQAVMQADFYIKSGVAKRALVIGAEILSRVSDPHDRDSMIYADGAGAVIFDGIRSNTPIGILSQISRSDTIAHSRMLWMDKSFNPDYPNEQLFLKMQGHNLYKYALQIVPGLVKESLDKAGVNLTDIKKVFIHQANNKMDEEILKRLFDLYGINNMKQVHIDNVMPMTISWLGNSSVATLPTLLDLMLKNKIQDHIVNKGDTAVLASVGAGMNVNAMVYKF
ncbi:MAG: ketoacyl-ACP synthase III [Bacteroidetes bacterium]|nr:MAG: ketoacyl-ACP synthase III [Bacteroidota bacterium]